MIKKILFLLLALPLFLAVLLFGSFNDGEVVVDFFFFSIHQSLGVVLVAGFAIGTLVGLAIARLTRLLRRRTPIND